VQLAADVLMEKMMQINTLSHTEFESLSVQVGEPFHCWECGSPDQGGMFLMIDHSPLEAFADHVYYMRLTCGHNPRCVRLGDAIAPLCPLDRTIDENLASIREGLTNLAKAVPSNLQNEEPASEVDRQIKQIVYLLVTGGISPQTAIDQLSGLVRLNESFFPVQLPINE
jgi:hypothetical protein